MKRTILIVVAIVLAAAFATELATASSTGTPRPPAPGAAKQLLSAGGLMGSLKVKLAQKKGKAAKPTVAPKRPKRNQGIALIAVSEYGYTVHEGASNWFWSPGHGLYVYYQWAYSNEIGACLGPYEHRKYFYWTGTHWDFLESWQYCGRTWRIVN